MATTVQPRASKTSAMTQVQPAVAGQRGPRTSAFAIMLMVLLAVFALLLFFLGRSLGIIGSGSTTKVGVPNVIGATFDDAKAQLKQVGLDVQRDDQANTAAAGTVFDQDPKEGTTLDKGAAVTLRVSTGPKIVTVPSVVTQDVNDARNVLTTAGFKVSVVTRTDSSQPPNRVISQQPLGNTQAAQGSTVTLTVSGAKPKVAVPQVTTLDENDAFAAITRAGLVPRRATEESTTVAQGKVIRTSPVAGAQVDQGSTVTVFVSSGGPTTTAPPETTTTSGGLFP